LAFSSAIERVVTRPSGSSSTSPKHPNENNASEAAGNQETTERRVAWLWRNLTDLHIQANTSPLAFIAGANTLDRQCAMRVTGVEGDIVFAYVKDENTRRNSPS